MSELRICFEVNGLGIDADGIPCPAGLQISWGQSEKEINYAELARRIDIPALLEAASLRILKETITPEDVKVITPEEYDRKYGEGSD